MRQPQVHFVGQTINSEGSVGVPNVETRRYTLRLTFLDRMCSQDTAAGSFWKEDAKRPFPSLRSVHSPDGETHRLPSSECPFYREYRHALKVFSRLQTGLSDSRPLSSKALYRCLVRWGASDVLIGELGVTAEKGCLLWPWAPEMRCLPSPGWSSGMPSGSERNCFQRNWPFRRIAVGAVLWRSLLTTPSFTVWSCSSCLVWFGLVGFMAYQPL